MAKEMKIINGEQYFVHQRTAPAVKRVGFVSDRMSYIVLRGRRCNIIVLNVHASSMKQVRRKMMSQKIAFMRN
jgi:hypothetical protein